MRAAVGRLGAVVAGGDEQEEAHHDLVLLELLAFDLGVDEDAGEVVGRVLAALGDHRPAAGEDLLDRLLDRLFDALDVGAVVGVVGGQRHVHQLGPGRVVLLGDAHEAADHPRDRRLGDVGDEVARLAALEPVEHAGDDLPDRLLVGGDPLRREARLEERLQSVVLGRVHADEHRPRQLDREDLVDDDDAAEFGGVGLPVAADLVDVVGAGHRPEALRLRQLGHLGGPVDRALAAHPLEQLQRRPVLPVLALEHEGVLDVPSSGGDLSLVSHAPRILLAGWPVLARTD